MFTRTLRQLWRDDDGSVIATEYMMLASVVALGGVTGMASLRDATVSESQETAQSIRTINQSYRNTGAKTTGASTTGAQVTDNNSTAAVGSQSITITP